MKPRKPPIVEVKKRRSTAPPGAPRGAPQDSKVRAWRDDHAAEAVRPPPGRAHAELLQAEIAVHVARLRLANDPDVLKQAGEKLAHRDDAERSMASIMSLPHHPLGPAYLIVAKPGAAFAALGRALKALFAAVTFVKPSASDARPPRGLRAFAKWTKEG